MYSCNYFYEPRYPSKYQKKKTDEWLQLSNSTIMKGITQDMTTRLIELDQIAPWVTTNYFK